MISSPSLQILGTVLAGLLIRSVLRAFVFRHPLDCIPGPPGDNIIIGNLKQIFSSDPRDFYSAISQKYKGVATVLGLFKERILVIDDPKALYHIFVKDQHIYEETRVLIAGSKVVFGEGLLSTLGDTHRKQRKIMNPVFSPAHMRTMTSQFFDITQKLRDVFIRKTSEGPQEIEVMSWLTRTSFEIIAQCGFGTSFDKITDDHSEHPFVKSAKLLSPVSRPFFLFQLYVLPLITEHNLGTPRFWRRLVDILPSKTLHSLRDIVDTMHETALNVFNEKKEALANDEDTFKTTRKDIMSALMHANSKASEEEKLPDNQVLAQITESSTFTFAAIDSTSSALSRIFWLLATYQDVQEKLRSEIREMRKECEEPDYDRLSAMPYLEAVVRETLRLNTSPDLWGSDSYEWKPERWLAPLPEKLTEARIPGVYSHLMTFVGGGRSCIGFKFAQMEIKVILYVLLDQHKFSLPKQEIFWNNRGIAGPSVDRSRLQPEMPLLVSCAN
ncbi:hypothetical protein EST38_g2750 [Candolleomyces aberdarensis]|uniref:Cytochrome P450 n=1 Tax=Candolleomyces aberdarensis TaxID=2316362 RepID=A0A4Q2DSS9_9AGAR|nr:hypothetical protein EST38_g2750 [Candolleomyces aberdarensis]